MYEKNLHTFLLTITKFPYNAQNLKFVIVNLTTMKTNLYVRVFEKKNLSHYNV